ncbi:MAG: VCBS repeat-containing protein, partial [Thermoplasmata archaeon]|nr:VCBS repeat-containing protein [Thermoplasmata archaeon]
NYTTYIDSDVAWDIPLLSVNNFVGVNSGLYTVTKNEYGTEYVVLLNQTESDPKYTLVKDAFGFILANSKMIINTFVYNSTTSQYHPTLKCYGGWSTDSDSSDSDNDGIPDGTIDLNGNGEFETNEMGEIVNNSLSEPAGCGTDPGRKDTDADGLCDKLEMIDGWCITGTQIRVYSDPLDPDSDDDKLSDYFEWYFGLDPKFYSTDTDELSDYGEIFSYWTVRKNSSISLNVSEPGKVLQEHYEFNANGDIEYGGSYWIKYTGVFMIFGSPNDYTTRDIEKSIRKSIALVNNSHQVDDTNDSTVYAGVKIDSIEEIGSSTNLYSGSYYYSYHFDIPSNPNMAMNITISSISNNDFSDAGEFLTIEKSRLERRGLISTFFKLDESSQFDYSGCDIDGDNSSDGPLDDDTDGEGLSDLYEVDLGSNPMDSTGDFDGDGILDKDEANNVYGTNNVNFALGKTAGTSFIIDDQKRIVGINEASYYYKRTGQEYNHGPCAVLDGNISTYWYSKTPPIQGNYAMIIVDIHHYAYITKVHITGESLFGYQNPNGFELTYYSGHYWKSQYSRDISQVANYSISEKGGYYDVTITFDKIWTRYLEINITSSMTSGGNVLIRELEVYGPAITNPGDTDTDGDGLSDYEEAHYGGGGNNSLNPVIIDTDRDGLPDGWIDGWDYNPISGWFFNYSKVDNIKEPWEGEDINLNGNKDNFTYDQQVVNETDPNNPDSDNDGMPDGWERYYLFNPLSSSDASLDNDDDNLSNLQEYIIGSNPMDDDSDNDGLKDGYEFHDVKFRTNRNSGILSSDKYVSISDSYWVMYDPTTIENGGEEFYIFNEKFKDIRIGEVEAVTDEFTMGLWKFDDQNNTTAFDSTHIGNNLALEGAQKTHGKFSGGIEFDGADDYAWCPHDESLIPQETLTISLWVKANSITGGTRTIVFKEGSYYLEISGGNLHGGIHVGEQEKYADGSINVGIWHHVSLVYDGSHLKMFVDGIKEHQVSASGLISAGSMSNFFVGGSSRGYFDGVIDDLMISNIPRPDTEYEVWTDGLWHFEHNNREMRDSSGNGYVAHPGTEIAREPSDPSLTLDGYQGNAIMFDGIDDIVTVEPSNGLDFHKTMTAEAWIKAENASIGTIMPIFFKENVFYLYLTAGNNSKFSITGVAWHNNDAYHITSDCIINPDKWYYVSLVVDKNNVIRVYVNSVEVGMASLTSNLNMENDKIRIGGNCSNHHFHGIIDEIRLSRTPYPLFFGNLKLPNVKVIGKLEDSSSIVKADFEDDDYDRIYIWEAGGDMYDRNENNILEGIIYEFLRDDNNSNIPENAKSDTPVLSYRLQELYIGDPLGTDTDSDGIPDGKELSPYQDSDQDGFINLDDRDSDNDGMSDYEEDLNHNGLFETSPGASVREPDPLDPDSDDDGLLDGEEYNLLMYYSPDRNEDEDFDSDNDGVTDFYDTDSDNDGVADINEVGEDGVYDAGVDTCPVNPDTDGDGLLDGENITVVSAYEDWQDLWDKWNIHYINDASARIFLGEEFQGTDPLQSDTDRDSLSDGEECSGRAWWFDGKKGSGTVKHRVLNVEPANYTYYIKARTTGENPFLTLEVKWNSNGTIIVQENKTSGLIEDDFYHWYRLDFQMPDAVPHTISLCTYTSNVIIRRGLLVRDGNVSDGTLKYGGSAVEKAALFNSNDDQKEVVKLALTVVRNLINYRVETARIKIELSDPFMKECYLLAGDEDCVIWRSDGQEPGSTFILDMAWAVNRYFAYKDMTTVEIPLRFYAEGTINSSGALNVSIDEVSLVPLLSDPLCSDTDEDNITDYRERTAFLTSCMNEDTDLDGIRDGVELNDLHGNRRKTTFTGMLYDSQGTQLDGSDVITEGEVYYLHIPRDDGLVGYINWTNITTDDGGYSFLKEYIYDSNYNLNDDAIGTGDFNGDGWTDVVGYDTSGLVISYGGNGEFVDQDYELINDVPQDIDVKDIDGDGYEDILTVTWDDVYVSMNDDGDGFTTWLYYELTGSKRGALGELTGDGYQDLIYSNNYREEIVVMHYDKEYGCFQDASQFDLNYPIDIATADFDHDGLDDLAVFNYQNNSYGISILLNDGDGSFAQVYGYGRTFYPMPVNNGDRILTADMNNDGYTDIISIHYLDNKTIILWNGGDGTFNVSNATTIEITGPRFTAVGDLDADGWKELIISNMTEIVIPREPPDPPEVYIKQYVNVFKNNRNKTFSEWVEFEGLEGNEAGAVAAADFDMDGSMDILYIRNNTIVVEERGTIRQVSSAYMNLTVPYYYATVTINIGDDLYSEFTTNVTSSGEYSPGNFTPDLSRYINSYLYTHSYRLDRFTDGLETDDYISIPITFSITGNGPLHVEETKLDLIPLTTSPVNPDTDNDKVTDGKEMFAQTVNTPTGGAYAVFTNPLDCDTDLDSIPDGGEDANRNGLVDWEDYNNNFTLDDGKRFSWSGEMLNETAVGTDLNSNSRSNEILTELTETDPLDMDSDEDGLTEWEEVYGFGTDPLDTDSDHDMIFDGTEVGRFVNTLAEVYNIPQFTVYDGGAMAHNAAATNGDQYIYGDHDSANRPTIPTIVDSDDDSLYDGFDDYGNDDRAYDQNEDTGEDFDCNGRIDWSRGETDPMNPDTDDDGIKDGDEDSGIFGYVTDKYDADTDDDGLSDYEELFIYNT